MKKETQKNSNNVQPDKKGTAKIHRGSNLLTPEGDNDMKVANPIYDVVFKYLLDDNKIAKKLLSLIIGKKIVSLDYRPTERRNDLEGRSISVFHIDFSAVVELEDGSKQHIIIELQKARYSLDIERFRRYLASQYANKENCYFEDDKKIAMPIFSIYFLGHYLEHTKVPVITVDRTYRDKATGEEITEKERFIEGLTHDSIVIQIPALKKHRRNTLEKVLSVFQTRSDLDDNHFIDIAEEDYPKEYKEVIRRLLQAAADQDIREVMILEDDAVELIDNYERVQTKHIATIASKDEALAGKDEVIAGKDRQLAKAAKTLAKSLGITLEEAEKMLSVR